MVSTHVAGIGRSMHTAGTGRGDGVETGDICGCHAPLQGAGAGSVACAVTRGGGMDCTAELLKSTFATEPIATMPHMSLA